MHKRQNFKSIAALDLQQANDLPKSGLVRAGTCSVLLHATAALVNITTFGATL